MSAAKTARWLDLIAYLLQHRFPVSRADIYRSVHGYEEDEEDVPGGKGGEITRRMFERDKDELRGLGISIETVPIPDAQGDEPATGYRLSPGSFYLPYLELHQSGIPEQLYQGLARVPVSPGDLEVLDRATQLVAQRAESPIGSAAASARRKLEFDLPLPQAAVERVLAAATGGETTRSLEVLQQAVAERNAVTCSYHSIGRNREEPRDIEPFGLFFNWGRWYCVGRARDRDALRVFRVDRMRQTALQKGKQARFTVPADFSIRAYLGRAPWQLSGGQPTRVRVRFAFPESRWVMAQDLGEPVEPMLDDGGAIIDFSVQDLHPFLRWLLTFRRQADVLSPQETRVELEALRGQVAQLYA